MAYVLTCVLLLVMGVAVATARVDAAAQEARQTAAKEAAPEGKELTARYCVSCHNDRLKAAGLTLEGLDPAEAGEHPEVWEKVATKLRAGAMPPVGRPRPDRASAQGFVSSLEGTLDRAAAVDPDPGWKEPLHRLNRAEYENAIRDLLALEISASSYLPPDDASHGFDNMGGVLRINQSLMDRYLLAARKISRLAVGGLDTPVSVAEFRAVPLSRQYEHVGGLPLGTRGGIGFRHVFPLDATYEFTLKLGPGVSESPRTLQLLVDGAVVEEFELTQGTNPRGTTPGRGAPTGSYQVRVPVKGGTRSIAATFVRAEGPIEVESLRRPFMKPRTYDGSALMPIHEPFLDSVEVAGPFDATGPGDTPSRRRIFVCQPVTTAEEDPCAKEIIASLGRRAFRRPLAGDEFDRLYEFYEEARRQESFDGAIGLVVRRLLVAPEFLFRVEADPSDVAPGSKYHLGDYELASRLSFFLWSSIPDDELLEAAGRGDLQRPELFERQVRRMLADDRSQAFIDNFFGQWLLLRNLDALQPAEAFFPDFDDTLRQAMRRETELFVESIVREDRSVLELLTADYTFVNERLARHYGLSNVAGDRHRRITLVDEHRRGLLGQGSILLATSRPNRTSPVLRGKWVLENILGVKPGDPPPNVPSLPEKPGMAAKAPSVRERMANHRKNPVCAGCHTIIDPPGFALENFDAVGRWREVDESFHPIDASAVLLDGTTFNGVNELRKAVVTPRDRFPRVVTERLLTYALGRGLTATDLPVVRKVVRDAEASDYAMSSLLVGIAKSVPFQFRRAAGLPPQSADNR